MTPFSLYRDENIVEHSIDQRYLSSKYAAEASSVIANHDFDSQNLFMYFSFNSPHDPLYAHPDFDNHSDGGLYGDVISDIDRAVGEVMAALEKKGVGDNSLVMLTSDNGPWFEGNDGGFRTRKASAGFEGGWRVPFVARWPAGEINTRSESFSIMHATDVFPTVLRAAGVSLPQDRIIDGQDALPSWGGTADAEYQSNRTIHLYGMHALVATRQGKWKLHLNHSILRDVELVHSRSLGDTRTSAQQGWMWLNDVSRDHHESYDLSRKYPQIAQEMFESAKSFDKALQEDPRGITPHAK